jgi:hypothetical protein
MPFGFVLALLLCASVAEAQAPKLFVFLATDLPTLKLQKALQNELAGVEVMAYGKSKDFLKAVKGQSADAILTYPVLLKDADVTSSVGGVSGQGGDKDKHVLVSLGAGVDLGQIAGLKVGVLDIVGRKLTEAFVMDFAGIGKPKKFTRTKKYQDLLALLLLKKVDAILLPSRLLPSFEAAAGAVALAQTDIPGKGVGLPMLGKLKSGDTANQKTLEDGVKKLSGELLGKLGVSKWRSL